LGGHQNSQGLCRSICPPQVCQDDFVTTVQWHHDHLDTPFSAHVLRVRKIQSSMQSGRTCDLFNHSQVYMTTQQPFLEPDSPDPILLTPEEPCGDSLCRSSGRFDRSVRVLTTSFMPGLFSGCSAQQVSMRVLSAEGHIEGMGRLYPFAACAY